MRSLIAEHPFLANLESDSLDALAKFSMERIFEDGTLIFEQGDMANRFYLITTGNVLISSEAVSGETVEIEMLGTGDVLGWSWLFEPFQWQFDAHAVGETETIFFYATPLLAYFEENPALGYELMRRVASIAIRRLQKTREKLVAGTVD